jgi:hypothetical protein
MQPDDEQELFDDVAEAVLVLREAMNTKKTKRVGEIRQLATRAYGILKPWLRKETE